MRKYATQKLLICPPHLHNAAALPGEKLISSLRLIARWFFFGSMWVALKRAGFWC